MRIAQVAPLFESVPPKLYGGTERVVHHLTEELIRQGHDVTLFASGDSLTQGRLEAICPQSLRLDPQCVDPLAAHVMMVNRVFRQKEDFDVIHFHVGYLHFPIIGREQVPVLTTLHGRLDIPDLVPLYKEFPKVPVVSISYSQRDPLPWLDWRATVHHGLHGDDYKFYAKPGKYLAFLGRISPEKGLDHAIAISRRTGIELKVAAKIDRSDRHYFENSIKPLLHDPGIEFIGEIGFPDSNAFLGNAAALLFPIQWPEPFGLVMIEAMAAGTPVIAYSRGSVPEVIQDGVSGFIVNNVEEAARAVQQLPTLDRLGCRKDFELRFSAARMCRDYVAVYEKLMQAVPEMVRTSPGDMSWLRSA
jgi:glycosyltransferase involved in cell wall biosynthesis